MQTDPEIYVAQTSVPHRIKVTASAFLDLCKATQQYPATTVGLLTHNTSL